MEVVGLAKLLTRPYKTLWAAERAVCGSKREELPDGLSAAGLLFPDSFSSVPGIMSPTFS